MCILRKEYESKFFRIPTFPVARLHTEEMEVLHIRSRNQKSDYSWLYAIKIIRLITFKLYSLIYYDVIENSFDTSDNLSPRTLKRIFLLRQPLQVSSDI